jgi:hypothetical protein
VNSGILLHPRLKKGSFGWRGAYYEGGLEEMAAKERWAVKIGFLRTGWWIIHFVGITLVYTLGHLLWR